jgi:hypothetical protein
MPVLAERKKGRARASSSPPTTTVAIGKGESASLVLVQQCSCGDAIHLWCTCGARSLHEKPAEGDRRQWPHCSSAEVR